MVNQSGQQSDSVDHGLDPVYGGENTGEANLNKPASTREDFAHAHSGMAAKQQHETPVPGPGPAESTNATDVVPAAQLHDELAKARDRVSALEAQQKRANIREYPKVLYHEDHGHKDEPVAPVTVASKAEEDEAHGHGWVHDNPSKARKGRGKGFDPSETPNATQHTREDENARRDLPAQMALDQDARTGKPPIDEVMDSDAPDPGAPGYQPQAGAAPVQQGSAKEATARVKNAAKRDDR